MLGAAGACHVGSPSVPSLVARCDAQRCALRTSLDPASGVVAAVLGDGAAAEDTTISPAGDLKAITKHIVPVVLLQSSSIFMAHVS